MLRLLVENHELILTNKFVKPRYFEDPVDSRICRAVLDLFREFQVPPTWVVIYESLKHHIDLPERKRFKARLLELRKLVVPESERRFISKQLRHFVGLQTLKGAIADSVPYLKKGDLESARHLIKLSLESGDFDDTPEIDYFADVRQRHVVKIRPSVCRTLIADLDGVLKRGGLARGELGVVLAVSNVGKTMCLCHLAKAAVLQRYKVLYLSLDDAAEEIIAERLDGSFSGVELRDLESKRVEVMSKIEKLGVQYGRSLIIKEFIPGTDMSTIVGYMDKLSATGFRPDVIVIDYVNIVGEGVNKYQGNRYKGLGNVYQDLKRLAKERKVVVWTAAQSNRSGVGMELITSANIAESFEGVHIANVIISLNRTPEERKREALRIFLAKNKTSLAEVVISIHTNFKKGAFYRKPA